MEQNVLVLNAADVISIDGVNFRHHPNGGGLVAETAQVELTAYVAPQAMVSGQAKVSGRASIEDRARVTDEAIVCDRAVVKDGVVISGDAKVTDRATIEENVTVKRGEVCGTATLRGWWTLSFPYKVTAGDWNGIPRNDISGNLPRSWEELPTFAGEEEAELVRS